MRAIDIERMKAHGLKIEDFKPQEKKEAFIEDEQGNKYKQVIKDGRIALEIVEDFKGVYHL